MQYIRFKLTQEQMANWSVGTLLVSDEPALPAECNPPPRRNGSREASGGMRFWCCLALACPALIAAVPSAELCRQCHAPEYEAHVRSAHFTAMKPARQSSFAQGLNGLTLRESADGYEFLYKLTAEGIAITAIRGTRRGEGLIEWVIGAGLQGQTPLVRTPQGLRESRVSYYPKLERYGVTFGHPAGVSSSPEAALGIAETKGEAQQCIGCHSSGVTDDLEPAVPGVQCWRCHDGALEHANGGDKPPFNPGKLSADGQVLFCAECHRLKAPRANDPGNVRFQPMRLIQSRCYKNSKALACTTCHVAHHDARRNDLDFYNGKCRGCHAAATIHADARGQGNCIGCHMPSVQLHPALRFTDHYIRIARSKSP